MKRILILFIVTFGFLMPMGNANASLTSLGTGTISGGGDYELVYDDLLGVVWLNYTKTNVTWQGAMDWADNLEVMFGGDTLSNWRLPHALPVNGSTYNYTWKDDGSTDRGYRISAPGTVYEGSIANELAHLYYNGLGNSADTSGNGPEQTGNLSNILGGGYWSETSLVTSGSYALLFAMQYGYQDYKLKTIQYNAIAVHPYASVPIPASVWILGSGLIGLAGIKRREEKS